MTTSPIDSALLPAEVRAGGAQARKTYETALGFERLLTTQLTKSMASALSSTTGSDASDTGDDSSGSTDSSSSTNMLQEQLPDQLAAAIEQGGGLGLAPVLYRSLTAAAAKP